jgi:hypothetical protein
MKRHGADTKANFLVYLYAAIQNRFPSATP